MMGSVMVGSGCASVANVRKDSESNGVGSTESLARTMVEMTKIGSCDSGGAMIDGRGRHLCSTNSSFLRAVNWRKKVSRNVENESKMVRPIPWTVLCAPLEGTSCLHERLLPSFLQELVLIQGASSSQFQAGRLPQSSVRVVSPRLYVGVVRLGHAKLYTHPYGNWE